MIPDEQRSTRTKDDAEICAGCRYFRRSYPSDRLGGWCQRRSPVANPADPDAHRRWPEVDIADWCGEYETAGRSRKRR